MTTDAPAPLYLTPKQAANAAQISATAIYEALADGDLRGWKRGNRWLITPDDLRAWVEATSTSNQQEQR